MFLETHVGDVRLLTPLILASGYITETPDFFLASQPYGCAAMVTRSLKEYVPPERSRVPAPRYAVFGGESMLNCEWGNERPWRIWLDEGVARVKKAGSPIIVSLSGRDVGGCIRLIEAFDAVCVDAFEINISCSHSGALNGNLNVDFDHLRNLLQQVRSRTRTPIWIKLSYSTSLVPMAQEAVRLGADAIVCTNSIGPGMLIDTVTGKSKLGIKGGAGGVTGKAIFPIALWCVHQLAQNVCVPIVGSGGVACADDVIQMLMAGASAVQLYTAPALRGPTVFKSVTRGLRKFLAARPEFGSIRELIGYSIAKTKTHAFDAPRPVVISERCVGCKRCLPACAFEAIALISQSTKPHSIPKITDACIACNACVGVCPAKFDAIKVSYER